MFDNLRQKSREQSGMSQEPAAEEQPDFMQEIEAGAEGSDPLAAEATLASTPARAGTPRILGMVPWQLFVLSVMLFMNVSMLGCLLLVAFEKIALF